MATTASRRFWFLLELLVSAGASGQSGDWRFRGESVNILRAISAVLRLDDGKLGVAAKGLRMSAEVLNAPADTLCMDTGLVCMGVEPLCTLAELVCALAYNISMPAQLFHTPA